MALFDKAIQTYPEFPGYKGNLPTTEQEYNSVDWFSDWQKPTWESVQAKFAELEAAKQAVVDARQSALNKLMALGLTEEEALALGVK